MNTQKSTLIRPYKYSSNGIEVFRRNNKDGTFDFAYIVEEYKWVEFSVNDDYSLTPINQYANLKTILAPDESNQMTFIVKGDIGTEWAEGGYLDLRFPIKKHQSTFDRIAQQKEYFDADWAEILYKMGFEEYDIVYTITFPQREEGK